MIGILGGTVLFDVPFLGDARVRHVAKTITWRIIGTIDTILLGWLVTGEFKKA